MVEGHSVHRVAAQHRRRLVGSTFVASSPNGRFTEGAERISGKTFTAIEAHGKNLFAFFGATAPEVLHVHFGMSGAWAIFDAASAPAPTPTTRLVLRGPDAESGQPIVAHLSAMTCAHGSEESLYRPKRALLGEDPLRADADPDRLWAKVSTSKKSIGALVMDQSCFCGPGNIYRAEILFKAGVHPTTRGRELSRGAFDAVWHHTVALLRRGYNEGSILTVDADDPCLAKAPGLRRYIYNAAACGRCAAPVLSWDLAGRTCYACPACQPLVIGVTGAPALAAAAMPATPPAKVKAPKKPKAPKGSKAAARLFQPESAEEPGAQASGDPFKAAVPHQPFNSHCAREPVAVRLERGGGRLLSVAELKAELGRRGVALPPIKAQGKAALVLLLEDARAPAVSAAAAAAEKARAGEKRSVEHVAELAPAQARRAAKHARAERRVDV